MEKEKIIIRPIVSEASLKSAESDRYVFEVAKEANKKEIAEAIREKFKVDVSKVQTRLIKGRSRRMLRRRDRVFLGPIKKADVQVGKGQKIDIFESKK